MADMVSMFLLCYPSYFCCLENLASHKLLRDVVMVFSNLSHRRSLINQLAPSLLHHWMLLTLGPSWMELHKVGLGSAARVSSSILPTLFLIQFVVGLGDVTYNIVEFSACLIILKLSLVWGTTSPDFWWLQTGYRLPQVEQASLKHVSPSFLQGHW